MSPQSPPRMLLLWYLIPCWPHSSQTIYSLFQGRLPIIFQVDASGLHQIFKKYIESILPYIYGLQPDWFIIKVGLSGHLAPERGDDYSLPHNWIQRQFFNRVSDVFLGKCDKNGHLLGFVSHKYFGFFYLFINIFSLFKSRKGVTRYGSFFAICNLVKKSKIKKSLYGCNIQVSVHL